MMKRLKRVIASCLMVAMALSLVIPSASAVSYNGSSSYQSGKYYKKLTNVQLTGNQREDIINVARSQVGYQESSSSSQLSGTVKGSKNYTEYGRWFGMQDMWCAMFVSWCAHVAGIPTSIVPSHSYTPTGLSWFRNRGQAYSRYTVANGGYTPEPGDIIYFKSSRNNNTTNHIGIVTGYSNGTVYTIEGNTSSATISTDGGAVCEKSYSIQNTYIVYICRPEYKNTAKPTPTPADWLTGEVKDIVFDAVYYADHHPDLRSQYGTDADALFDYFLNQGIQAGHQASPTFDIRYYVENNEDIRATYGTDYVAAMKHFVSTGINEARVTAEPLDLGNSFQARISFPAAGLNFSLSDTNVITYNPSDSPAQVWTFERHPAGAYRIINSKNGYSLAVDGYDSECNVHIAEYRDSRRQLWYIYERECGRYVFRSMASSCCVIDVYGGVMTPSTNVWSYTYNGTDAQLLGIEKLSGLAQMSPVDLGTGFYAKINASDGMNLSLEDENVIIYSDSDALAQVWRFDRQSDGSYEIVNQKNGLLLDTYWAQGTSDTNVQIYQDHDNIAQRWFVYQTEGGYVFRPACSQTCVLDVTGNGTAAMTNVRTYVYNGSDAQTFQLISVPPVVNFDAPVQLGADFYANINLSSGMSLSLQDTNVIINNASTAPAQVWRFALQSDGSYYIVNQENEMLLDVYWAKDESGTNVQVYPNNNSIAHKWFIYQSGDKYVFRPAFSETRVLNVAGNSMAPETNVEIHDFTGAEGQRFDIQILDHYVNLNRPLDLGTDFYAKISASGSMNLSLIDENVIIHPDNTEAAQVWQFVRQDNGSYHIINQKNSKLLDVYWAKDESGTNVQVYEDNDSIAHKWFIYQSGDKYVFRPACSETRVLNVAGNSMAPETNVEIHELTGASGQRFGIQRLENYADLGHPLDLGTDFYAKINASDGMNLSLEDENVIIYPDSTAPAQVWKFVRQDNGSYQIVNQKNSLLLTVAGGVDASCTNVLIAPADDSDAQKWYIYQSGEQYVLRPACSYSRVLDVYGDYTDPMTNVQIYTFHDSEAHKFRLLIQENYTEGLSDANMAVLRTIMYAVETGGQVYGQADYSDFTEAYTNTSLEHAITIGAGQWYGPEAKELLNRIRQADPSGFAALDTAGIASDLDSKDWSTYQVSKGSAKATCIQAIISTDVGKRCQDQMMDEQLTKFMQEAAELGVTDQLAQMMCANIRHLGGLSAVKRILAKTEQPYTIHTIYAALLTDTGSNQVGTFRSRNKMVYESLLANFS